MADTTVKKVVSVSIPEATKEQVYEESTPQPARVRTFTVEQIDAQVASLQAQIDELEAKKAKALAL